MALARDPKYTLEEYLRLDEESELPIEYENGYLYAMAGETGEHNDVVNNLVANLLEPVRAKGCRLRQQGVKSRLNSRRYYYPDLMILCGPRGSDPRVESDPCLLVEVLSPSTAYRDRGQKLNAHLRLGSLEKYLLISPEVMQVGVYSRGPQGWLYEVVEEGSIEIPCIAARLSLEQIYRGVPLKDR